MPGGMMPTGPGLLLEAPAGAAPGAAEVTTDLADWTLMAALLKGASHVSPHLLLNTSPSLHVQVGPLIWYVTQAGAQQLPLLILGWQAS